jgi:RNA polymerase sigma factor (sigma-70 family)
MGDALAARMPPRPFRSKRLLALAGDERLVEQIRRGNELAFEVAFERHGGGILGFCRHMLGSAEEAEDAVQHTFAAAFRDLQRGGARQIMLKPWLYTIARNRCVSVLRARREQPAEMAELPTEGLHEQVARRTELRELLGDLRELPEEQRAALLLAEAADLSHAEVAGVLGCEVARVKALVFRARSGLIERRDARETPCAEIREQLANLRGGSLRRSELRHHVRYCTGCRDYREQVRQQRQMLAVALPVAPTLGLKSSVLSAAGGGAAAAGGGGMAIGGSLGSAAIAKVALIGVLAGGGLVAGEAAVERATGPDTPQPAVALPAAAHRSGEARLTAPSGIERAAQGALRGKRMSTERSHGRRGAERRAARSRGRGNAGAKAKGVPRRPEHAGGGKRGQAERLQKQKPAEPRAGGHGEAPGRGQAEAPSSNPPVRQAAPSPKPTQPKAQVEPPAPLPTAPGSGKLKLSK